jgi:hypothetical protein
MRKGFLIYEEMRKYLAIYEEAVSHDFATAPFCFLTVYCTYDENFVSFLSVYNRPAR